MSGLETEEPILQPGRIDVLLGQGQTAQVLRNLCLMVYRESSDNWLKVRGLVKRLFSVDLSDPKETSRGTIELHYRQDQVKDELDIALAGRGFQQTLLIFSYLYSHPKSVLLIDEPDAHLEILRQKQIYALLRDIAAENESQVILVTHSEVVLNEALDTNLTLLIGSQADDLASKSQIKDSLKHYGAEHYVRAKQAGYVLYLEGSTDLSMLKELAKKIQHPVLDNWSDRANVYYVQDNYPDEGGVDAALDRVEGGFGITPREHFGAARGLVEGLKGLAILDSDGRAADSEDDGQLRTVYWKRYELENYFISPGVLRRACIEHYGGNFPLFGDFQESIENVLNDVTREYIFDSDAESFETWRKMNDREAKVLWLAQSRAKKLSAYAEEFFRRLATELGHAMLYRKSNLFELIRFIDSDDIDKEIIEKLNALQELFQISRTDVK
jgi:ABC-type multidrug transport system ATPase subunit